MSKNIHYFHRRISLSYKQFVNFFVQQNISIAVVGKNEKFHILGDEENSRYVASVEKRTGAAPGHDGSSGTGEPSTIEDIDDPRDDPRDDQGPGDPQPQVAMET